MSDSQLLTALTTELFTLQGARAQTMSESSARASLYIVAVSSTLVALGFVTQLSEIGDVFNVFALTVLPTLYVLGAVTFVRLVECSAEDFRYGLAINRIRAYYKEIAGDRADLFLLSAHDDPPGVLASTALSPLRYEGRSRSRSAPSSTPRSALPQPGVAWWPSSPWWAGSSTRIDCSPHAPTRSSPCSPRQNCVTRTRPSGTKSQHMQHSAHIDSPLSRSAVPSRAYFYFWRFT